MNNELNRRALLRGLGALGLISFAPRRGVAARLGLGPGLAPGESEGTLVLLQFSGGNDGLSMVVPHGDDAYYAARKSIAHQPKDVLALDEYRGLNPKLEQLRARFDAGEVAIVEGCGYPKPNRSHFKSMEIWHAA